MNKLPSPHRAARPWRSLAALAVVAAVSAPFSSCGPDTGPLAMAELDADKAIGAVAVLRLHLAGRRLLQLIDMVPATARAALGPARDRAALTEALGFDPTTRKGWLAVGVDPDRGLTLAFDRRMTGLPPSTEPQPVLMLRVRDEAALRKFLQGHVGKPLVDKAHPDSVREVHVGRSRVLVAARGGWTALVSIPRAASAAQIQGYAKALAAFCRPTGKRVGRLPQFELAVAELNNETTLLAWANLGMPVGGRFALAHELLGRGFSHVMAGTSVAGGFARITADKTTTAALADVLRPADRPPAFAERIPDRGWLATRATLRLDKLPGAAHEAARLVGLDSSLGRALTPLAKLPPAVIKALAAGLTGHVCVALRQQGLAAAAMGKAARLPDGLLLLGVKDPKGADRLLSQAAQLLTARGVGVEPLAPRGEGGPHGVRLTGGPLNGVHAVRDGDLLVIATSQQALESALARPDNSLTGTPSGDMLDRSPTVGVVMDLHAAISAAVATWARLPRMAPAVQGMRGLAARLQRDPLAWLSVGLDEHGLLGRGGGGDGDGGHATTAVVGILAAVAIPQFVKYMRRAKASAAHLNLQRIKRAAQAYYAGSGVDPQTGQPRPCTFPAAAPLTPAASCCDASVDRDDDDRCDVDAGRWQQAGWRALGFSLAKPHYYQYAFHSTGVGKDARFTVTAYGDLDCDGIRSTFQLIGRADPAHQGPGCAPVTFSKLFADKPDE